jgi:hypothetical protein
MLRVSNLREKVDVSKVIWNFHIRWRNSCRTIYNWDDSCNWWFNILNENIVFKFIYIIAISMLMIKWDSYIIDIRVSVYIYSSPQDKTQTYLVAYK